MPIARRQTDVHIDNVRYTIEAGEEVPEELIPYIDNNAVFQGETRHSPGNPQEDDFDEGDEFDAMTVAQLRQYAADNNIEITSTKKAEIADEIRAAVE